MPDENLKDLSIDELLVLLGTAQRDYSLARSNKAHQDLIQEALQRLQAIQKAIVDKRDGPLAHLRK